MEYTADISVRWDGFTDIMNGSPPQIKAATSKRVKKYNAANKLMESDAFDETGNDTQQEIVKSDSSGRTMKVMYLFEKGILVKTSEGFFDEKGNNVENHYFTDTRLTGKEINRFDNRGNRVETIIQYPVKKEERITHYKYDSLNNTIETIALNGSLMIASKIIVRYDDQHNVVELVSYGIKGNVKERIGHHYEYDGEGNWIKDITFENKKPVSVGFGKLHTIDRIY